MMNSSIRKHQAFSIGLGISSATIVGLFAVSFLHIFNINSASATDTSVDINVNLSAAIEIWTTDTSDHAISTVDITAPPDQAVHTGTVRTHVSTNNLTGYTLTIHSASSDSKMTHSEAPTISSTIDPLTGNGTSTASWASDSALDNMWGYDIDSHDSYLAVPNNTTASNINDSTDPVTNDTTDTTFGTKVDLNLPAGTYSDTVIFSAVANAVPGSYMQDFTKEQCQVLPTWQSSSDDITLIDKRDNNSYVIRKLADGNCWMTQNLRLSAESLTANSHSTTLDSSDTDLSSTTFTIPASAEWNTWDSTNPHVIRAQDAPVGKKTSEGGTPISEPTATYRGTYYNWVAAIAQNSDSSSTSVTKTTSICPKGWKLPTGEGTIEGTSTTTTNQFTTLYSAYSSNKANMDAALHYYNGNNSATYAGFWKPGNVYLGNSGVGINFWSSTSSTIANSTWNLGENIVGDINPTYNSNRGGGYSVRCLINSSS